MASDITISDLKSWLVRDVDYLSRRSGLHWNGPIVATIRELELAALPAVYFGGTLRSLLLARLAGRRKLGRPRDLDIVVADDSVDRLRDRLRQHVLRETRFGGLKLWRESWQFDVWPLNQTWAFKEDASIAASFESLPATTFFNLEAIAVDAWTKPGVSRQVYSGDDRFFDGLLSRTVELNRESNPFPALCVVRSLVLASSIRFFIGPRLAAYLAAARDRVTDKELDDVQRHHYGGRRMLVADMRRLLDYIVKSHIEGRERKIKLPHAEQLHFWEDIKSPPSIKFQILRGRQSRHD